MVRVVAQKEAERMCTSDAAAALRGVLWRAYPEEVVLLLRVELPRVHLDLLLMEIGRVLHEALRNNKKKKRQRSVRE